MRAKGRERPGRAAAGTDDHSAASPASGLGASPSRGPGPPPKAEEYQGGRSFVSLEAGPRDSYTPPPVWWGSGRTMRPSLPPGYRPSEDEEFMNPLQLEYFRQKLLRWRAELLAPSTDTLQHLREESLGEPDLTA